MYNKSLLITVYFHFSITFRSPFDHSLCYRFYRSPKSLLTVRGNKEKKYLYICQTTVVSMVLNSLARPGPARSLRSGSAPPTPIRISYSYLLMKYHCFLLILYLFHIILWNLNEGFYVSKKLCHHASNFLGVISIGPQP